MSPTVRTDVVVYIGTQLWTCKHPHRFPYSVSGLGQGSRVSNTVPPSSPALSCHCAAIKSSQPITEQYEWTLFSDDEDEDEASRLCNMAMLCGPTGVGKTSAVYG